MRHKLTYSDNTARWALATSGIEAMATVKRAGQRLQVLVHYES